MNRGRRDIWRDEQRHDWRRVGERIQNEREMEKKLDHIFVGNTSLTLLLLTGSETVFFGIGCLGICIRCTYMRRSLLTIIHVVVQGHQYP
ncbi:hypothetical protein JHK85_050604 [Glycine max]|nr:hypothetical protein JHK85_050604 [Glycine max]